jgi:hypothetical protein
MEIVLDLGDFELKLSCGKLKASEKSLKMISKILWLKRISCSTRELRILVDNSKK